LVHELSVKLNPGMTPGGGQNPGSGELLGLGAAIAGAMIVPLVAGALIDGALRTGPIFLIIGVAVGIVSASVTAYMRIKRYL
jgi:F0F1-type ATP synthase assembly protein I